MYFLELDVEQLLGIYTFIKNRYSIVLTSRKDYPMLFSISKKMSAFYHPLSKMIVLFSDDFEHLDESNKFLQMRKSLYHEYGHYLDEYCGYISNTREFKRYFRKQKKEKEIKGNKVSFLYMYKMQNNIDFKTIKAYLKYTYDYDKYIRYINYKYSKPIEYFAETYVDYLFGKCTDTYMINLFKNYIMKNLEETKILSSVL